MDNETKPKRGQDKTGARRQQALRERKPRVEAYLTPAEFRELAALIAAGEGANQADLIRLALHEKYLGWAERNAARA